MVLITFEGFDGGYDKDLLRELVMSDRDKKIRFFYGL